MELEYIRTLNLPDDLDAPRKMMYESLEDEYTEEELRDFFERLVNDTLAGDRDPVEGTVKSALSQAYDNPEMVGRVIDTD